MSFNHISREVAVISPYIFLLLIKKVYSLFVFFFVIDKKSLFVICYFLLLPCLLHQLESSL